MFRFTIRDLLWLTTLVAVTMGMGLAWWITEQTRGPENARLRREIEILLERDEPSEALAKSDQIKKLMFLRAKEAELQTMRNNDELEAAIKSVEQSIEKLRSMMRQKS
jgi:hypothetical protein